MVTVAVEWSSAEDQVPPTLTSGNDSIANDNSTTGRRKKRAVVTEPVPTVTGFILVLGLDPLDDPYEDPSAAYVIELVSVSLQVWSCIMTCSALESKCGHAS